MKGAAQKVLGLYKVPPQHKTQITITKLYRYNKIHSKLAITTITITKLYRYNKIHSISYNYTIIMTNKKTTAYN